MPGVRVIGGSARGRRLRLVPGAGTRPIGDRVKESLFNILGADVVGARFLDLFAGTGSVGIEALSRGASAAVFVDTSLAAIRTIRSNLEATGLADRAMVLARDALALLEHDAASAFDYIYVAPPQYHRLWIEALGRIDARPEWLSGDGWVVVQIDPREQEDVSLGRLSLFDERTHGQTRLLFYRGEV